MLNVTPIPIVSADAPAPQPPAQPAPAAAQGFTPDQWAAIQIWQAAQAAQTQAAPAPEAEPQAYAPNPGTFATPPPISNTGDMAGINANNLHLVEDDKLVMRYFDEGYYDRDVRAGLIDFSR